MFILATVFGCLLPQVLLIFFHPHFDSLCPPGKSVLKSKEQQMTSELRPSNSSLTAEEQEKEQEKVRLAWTYIYLFSMKYCEINPPDA